MSIVIDEVRAAIEPERRPESNVLPTPTQPPQLPREQEIEKYARDVRGYERRLLRLRAD